jgi:uncharacterized protein (TIGR02265 family)
LLGIVSLAGLDTELTFQVAPDARSALVRRMLELCPAAYRVSTPSAEVSIVSIQEGRARVALRRLWNLPDLHQVGIFEGAMDVCGAVGTIEVERHSLCDADFDIRGQVASASR